MRTPPTSLNPGRRARRVSLAPAQAVTVALGFFAIAVIARRRRAERRRRPSRLGRALRVPAGGGGRSRRRLALPGARRPDPRGAEGLRLSATAPVRAGAADGASGAGRVGARRDRGCWRSSGSRCTSSACGTPLLRGGLPLGAGDQRRAALERLDPAGIRTRRRCGVTATRCGRPAWALGLAVSAKLLFWPMYVWMLATRRLRAARALARDRRGGDARRLGGDRVRRA